MKSIKLSLVAALAAGALTSASAVPFEEAIKNVDFTGQLRYRYDTASWKDKEMGMTGTGIAPQSRGDHRYRIRLGAKADIADRFKVFGQVQYGNDWNYGYSRNYNGTWYESKATSDGTFNLRQAYVQYDASDYGVNVYLGKQELGTLWTNDMAGMAAKTTYNGLEGITLAAFAVDSFEDDGDRAFGTGTFGQRLIDTPTTQEPNKKTEVYSALNRFVFKQNFYGAAAIADYDLGGSTLGAQVWLGYLNKRATFYALDVKYGLDIDEGMNYTLIFDYLGNSVDSALKKGVNARTGNLDSNNIAIPDTGYKVANGNFIALKGIINAYGLDASLGGMMYGKKGEYTINTIEDNGQLKSVGGRELTYMDGSRLTDTFGQNTFGYLGLGYTYEGFRVGAQYVMGATKAGKDFAAARGGGSKQEIVGELSYKYNKNLDFLFYYSNLSYKQKSVEGGKGTRDAMRLQALYNF